MDSLKILRTYSFLSQFSKGINNDTKHNVQTNGGNNDEE